MNCEEMKSQETNIVKIKMVDVENLKTVLREKGGLSRMKNVHIKI